MTLKRLATTLNASFESFVNGVENHDALAQGAIADVRKAAARLRGQKGALDAQNRRLADTRQTLQERRDRWQQRAEQLADNDPDQALLCLRRRDGVIEQLSQLSTQMAEQTELATELDASLVQVEQRLVELQNRRTALSSREAKAAMLAKVDAPNFASDIDELFSRWEVSVLEDEYRDASGMTPEQHSTATVDELDNQFLAKEADQKLLDELAQMRAPNSSNKISSKENNQ